MGYANEVVQAIDAGHITRFDKDRPGDCKKCSVPAPCPEILRARQAVRRLHGIKVSGG